MAEPTATVTSARLFIGGEEVPVHSVTFTTGLVEDSDVKPDLGAIRRDICKAIYAHEIDHELLVDALSRLISNDP